MKTLRIATIALASAGIALSAPLAAQDQDSSILVQPSSETTEYVARVAEQLDQNLARAHIPFRSHDNGVVRVRFTANGAGEAEDVEIVGRSRSRDLDRAALWAVNRLSDISPDFAGHSEGQLIQANIIFANTERQAERIARRVAREDAAQMALARQRGEPPVLALTISGSARAR
ncbi:energy transducer TonB [Erythrobacter alti]|uniref:energy transducer TonB family protein n=1 Tax=Erythrobacter alti TaxID=1896145 RepID=UPI0030F4A160